MAEDRRRAGELYRQRVYDDATLARELAAIDTRAAALTAASNPTRDPIGIAALLPHLAALLPGDQNGVLREIVDRIELDGWERRIVWRGETLALFDAPPGGV
ncbi:MAG: hypothetical protein KGL54_13440 [Sphingomonadales bacterium]|nr:hypothetical protein [Sphingomonadales bacterium]